MSTLVTYYKFTNCCDGTEIFFRGYLSLVNNAVYKYIGTSSFPGTGGSLVPSNCYTLAILTTNGTITYPPAPSSINFTEMKDCTDESCAPCSQPTCLCPDGYDNIDGDCVKTSTVEAEYTGGLLTVEAGSKSTYYTDSGVRLYSDITSAIFPIKGAGISNAAYTVKANNGTGALIPQLSNVMSNLWGSSTVGCDTGSTDGRLNKVGIWAPGIGTTTELCFEFCVTPTVTKQYLIGIAGDNEVKLYLDGNLIVNLTGSSAVTVPFRHWHVFPITLTAGQHTIGLCGYDYGTPASFGAEIYDIDVATFQANLLDPSVGTGNCGNVPADLTPYIIFSTTDMIDLQIADPANPGVWECPTGYTLDECQGVPMCTINESFKLACPCYLLIPCDTSVDPFISSTPGLDLYINNFVSVGSADYTGCVFVSELSLASCDGAVDVIIDGDAPCNCTSVCYYIEGAQGINYVEYVDGVNQLVEITPIDSPTWLTVCSKVLPILGNTNGNYTITALGNCDIISSTASCPEKCFKLVDCLDDTNIIYSNSYGLLPYVSNNKVIKIAGYTECWQVETTTDPCDCAIDVIVTASTVDCESCKAVIAYKLTSCDNTFDTQYTYDDLSQYVNQTVLTDCGCFLVELIDYAPPSVQTITIITSFRTCLECTRPYYFLEACNDDEPDVYTFSDLSAYIGQIVKIENCDTCFTVLETDVPINPGIVNVVEVFQTCIQCITAAPCVCSTVRNDNAVEYTYRYLDCYGDTQSVTLAPGETSDKICLIKWLESEDCDCLIQTYTNGSTVTTTIRYASGELINNRPSWEAFPGGSLLIYYNGTQWIINNSAEYPQYFLPPSDAHCPEGTWHAVSSIPSAITISTVRCKAYYKFYGECVNGVCPAPVYIKRSVKPGYNTPACSPEKYEKITCKASQALYRNVLELRYGISNCCPEEEQYWLVKKELIDLAALYNPDYPCAPNNSCGCDCPPSDCSCSGPKTCNS